MPYPRPRQPRYSLAVRRAKSGLGLFAQEDIPAGRFVIEYWGEVVSDDRAPEVGGKYLFDLENGRHILGGTRENVARYANHSCRPNCEVRVTGDRVFIWSIRPIAAGDEISYDYGKEYVEAYIAPHGCRCASCVKKRAKETSGVRMCERMPA